MNHPTWSMGPVITVNSATLVNKGLEVIEAHLLFGIPFDRIEVVVHPTSVVHSMVEFVDGSTLLQASPPTMMIPIALGLAWPRPGPRRGAARSTGRGRRPGSSSPLDDEAFPAVRLAREAGEAGATAPAVYNAANEVCVEEFLAGRLPFREIVATIADVLGARRTLRGAGTHRGRRPGGRRLGPRRGDTSDHRREALRMSALYYTLGVLIFVVAILASIALHELGHMIPAKKFGGKVTQYFVGFGRTVWSKKGRRDGVRLQGDPARWLRQDRRHAAARRSSPTSTPRRRRQRRSRQSNTGMFTQLIADARAAEAEHVEEGDEDRLFYKMPGGRRSS